MPQEPLIGAENMMTPGPVPPELQGLTMLEEQLIARAYSIARVYLEGGSVRYFGLVRNYSQGFTTFVTSLPWHTDSGEIPNISICPPGDGMWHKRNYTVSRERVQRALTWLITNSPAYADVRLDVESLDRLGPVGGRKVDHIGIGNFLYINEPGEDGDDGATEVENDTGDGRRDKLGVGAPVTENDCEVDDSQDATGGGTRPPSPPK